MTVLRNSILIMTLFILSAYASTSSAQEIVLCINTADQYVVVVGQDGDCLEEESQVKVTGSAAAEFKGLTPVAVFEDYEQCETEGSVTKLGFDKNDNFELDEDEIMSTSRNCKVVPEGESEE